MSRMTRAVFMLAMLIPVVSGCASVGARQELARLQSQVGLLDERVTQLERVGSSGTWLNEPSSSQASTGPGVVVPAEGAPISVSPKPHLHKPSAREIQQALKNAGFYQGAVDGKMGPKTRDAVKEFQHTQGLHDDGVVGKQTWAKLHAYLDLSAGNGDAHAAQVAK